MMPLSVRVEAGGPWRAIVAVNVSSTVWTDTARWAEMWSRQREWSSSQEMMSAGVPSASCQWVTSDCQVWLGTVSYTHLDVYKRQGQRREVVAHDEKVAIRAGSPESAAQAEELLPLLQALADMSSANEASLGKLDSIAGDGDHGQGMVLGSTAALKAAKQAVAAHAGTSTLFDLSLIHI